MLLYIREPSQLDLFASIADASAADAMATEAMAADASTADERSAYGSGCVSRPFGAATYSYPI